MTGVPSKASPDLAPECRVLTRYLTGSDAATYVLEKYQACHAGLHAACGAPPSWFDRVLLVLARRAPFGAGVVDTYSRWFAPRSLVRHKLTLLLAVLEHSPEFYGPMTSATVGPRWTVIGRLMLAGLRESAVLLISVLVIGPLHVYAITTGRQRR